MDVSSFLKALDTQQIIEKAKDIASKAKTKIKSIAPQRNENEVDLSLESIIVEGSTDSERTAIVRKVFQHSLAQNIPGVSVEQKLEVSKARILTLPNYRTCEIGVETLPRPSRIRFWSPHPRVLRIKLTESGWRQGRIFVGIEGGKPVGQLSLSTWNRLPGHRTLRAVGSMAPRTGESQDFGLLQYTNPTPPPGLPAVTLQLGHHNTHHGEPALAHSLATTHCEAALQHTAGPKGPRDLPFARPRATAPTPAALGWMGPAVTRSHLTLRLAARLESRRLRLGSTNALDPTVTGCIKDAVKGGIQLGLRLDRVMRHDGFPLRGFATALGVEVAGLVPNQLSSPKPQLRAEISQALHWSVPAQSGKGAGLHLLASAGALATPFRRGGDSPLDLVDRFHLGGPSLPGYSPRCVGPLAGPDWVGGEAYATTAQVISLPVGAWLSAKLEGVRVLLGSHQAVLEDWASLGAPKLRTSFWAGLHLGKLLPAMVSVSASKETGDGKKRFGMFFGMYL